MALLSCQSGRYSIYKKVNTEFEASIHIKQTCDSIEIISDSGM